MQNVLLWTAVFVTGGVHAVPLAGHLAFYPGRDFSVGRALVRLHRGREDRRFAQQRAAVGQSAVQRNHRDRGSRRADFDADRSRHLPRGHWASFWCRGNRSGRSPVFVVGILLLPIGAAFLTGMNHPIRRYVLTMANEPLFFSALMGLVSFGGFLIYLAVSPRSQRLVWNRQAIWPFLTTGSVRNLFDPVHHYRHQSGPGRDRRADRRELSGLVVDLRGDVSARCRSGQLESDRRHHQRRGGKLCDSFGPMIDHEKNRSSPRKEREGHEGLG